MLEFGFITTFSVEIRTPSPIATNILIKLCVSSSSFQESQTSIIVLKSFPRSSFSRSSFSRSSFSRSPFSRSSFSRSSFSRS